MRRHDDGFVGFFLDTFSNYIDPRQEEDSFLSSSNGSKASRSLSDSDKPCLLIFIFAFVFIGVASPILCFSSLFIKLNLEGLWYFWIITFSEVVYLVWLVLRKKGIKQHRPIYTKNAADTSCLPIISDFTTAS